MKALPFVLLALAIVGGVIAYMLVKNPSQNASVTAGVPTIGGGGDGIDPDFVDSLPPTPGFV